MVPSADGHRAAWTPRRSVVAVVLALAGVCCWVLRDYSAVVDGDVIVLEAVATAVVLVSSRAAPTRSARRALSLLAVYTALTLVGDSYWLLTVDPTGLSYLDGESEPGFTVAVLLVRYLALFALLAHVTPRGAATRRAWWAPGKAALAQLQMTTATAALALVATPLGDAVDDGTSYSLFCFFDVVTVAIAVGAVTGILTRHIDGRTPSPHDVRRRVATAAGVGALVLGDAAMVTSQTHGWTPGGATGLALAVAGVGVVVVTGLSLRDEAVTASEAMPPTAPRTPAAVAVPVSVAIQCVGPAVIAALAWAELSRGPEAAPGPATLGTVAAALVLSIAHAGARALNAHRDNLGAAAAGRDDLTGAWSRRGLVDVATAQLAVPGSPGGGPGLPRPREGFAGPGARWSVALIDLDGFKAVNDTLGHGAGDDTLRAVAHRLAAVAGGRGIVARFGGDEFVLLLDAAGARATSREELTRELLAAVAEPLAVRGGNSVRVGLSVGFADVDDTLSAALKLADERMYAHKRRREGTPQR